MVYNQNMAVFHIGAVSKDIKSKINFYRHNILRPFDNLAFLPQVKPSVVIGKKMVYTSCLASSPSNKAELSLPCRLKHFG